MLVPEEKEQTEDTLQEETKTYTVKENPVYFAPEKPTAYIAETYDALSASLKDGSEEVRAQAAAMYFLADFFTLSNKEEEGDIGGLDLIPSASADAFREYAKYYYYHVMPEIRSKQGPGALPEVGGCDLYGSVISRLYLAGEADLCRQPGFISIQNRCKMHDNPTG